MVHLHTGPIAAATTKHNAPTVNGTPDQTQGYTQTCMGEKIYMGECAIKAILVTNPLSTQWLLET